MKIGILTFHEIYNPGAFLQAYATLLKLRELGHDPCIINYTAPDHRFRPLYRLIRRPLSVVRHPKTLIDSIIRNKAFSDVHEVLNPTKELRTHSELRSEHFDAIIVGSDIVWNYQSKQWGSDPVYFGHHLNCDRLVAYAASCGPLDVNAPAPDFVREGLKKFSAISVRDRNSALMVKKQIGISPDIVMDPTFHLNLNTIKLQPCKHLESFFLVYAMPQVLSEHAIEAIRLHAKNNELRVISICYRNDWADLNLLNANPFDWLAYINSAACVFTNTFHGTIFSIKYQKRFATEMNSLVANKTKPLLEELKLQDHIFSEHESLDDLMCLKSDFRIVNNTIEDHAENNIAFLTNALSAEG